MTQAAENCPDYANTPELEKPTFAKGWTCGYTVGIGVGKSAEYMNAMAKRLVPMYGGIGFILGALAVLSYIKFS